jgi:hypothetical protein
VPAARPCLHDRLDKRSHARLKLRLRSTLATSIVIMGIAVTIGWTAFLGWNAICFVLLLMDVL